MARPTNREERRADIVAGLMKTLPRYGYERSTTARIAEAAGLSTGLIHHHFANKQAILLALADTLDALVRARMQDGSTPRKALHAFIDAHLALGEGASEEAVGCWVALGAEAVFQPEVGEVYRAMIESRRDELLRRLRDVCRDEGRSTRGLDVVAGSLLALVEGFFQLAAASPGVIPRGSAAANARAIADKLLDAQPSRPSKKET